VAVGWAAAVGWVAAVGWAEGRVVGWAEGRVVAWAEGRVVGWAGLEAPRLRGNTVQHGEKVKRTCFSMEWVPIWSHIPTIVKDCGL
jgi:hypothetical protein